jgi:hypothetical protein
MARESLGPAGSPAPAQPWVAQRSRWWLWGALTVAFLRVLPALRFPLGRDEATYCFIGQDLLRGQVLYRDLWDNKPPGIFYIYAVIVKIFGPVMWSVGIVDILWLLAISVCIFYFAKRYLGAPAAAIAVVSNALWHCSQGYTQAVQPEAFVALFVFLAYFLLMSALARNRWGNVAAGLLCGAAFWMKYNAAPLFPALTFLPYLDFSSFDTEPRRVRLTISWRTWWVRTLLVMTGFVLAILGVLLYFWAIGALPALREVQFEVLPRYGSMFLERIHHYSLFALDLIHIHLGVWTEVTFGVALVIARRRRELGAIAPVVMMALAGFISTASQIRFSPFAFETAYPFFAMLWGYVIFQGYEGFQYLRGYFRRRGWRLAGALLWLMLAQVVYFPLPDVAYSLGEEYGSLGEWVHDPQRSYASYSFPHPLEKLHDQLAVIDYLKYNATSSDAVFVWGTAPLINFLAQRPNPSRFVSNLALVSPWGPVHWRQELIGELNRKPPRFIVVARHDTIPFVTLTHDDSEQSLAKFPALAAFIRNHYEPVENLDDFELYERKTP